VYTERMMVEQGFLGGDPLMHLIQLKWYLRTIGNALLDQGVHVDDMSREDAMRLMTHDTFQEEREASAKWVRAQLTSATVADLLRRRAGAPRAYGRRLKRSGVRTSR